MSLLSLFAFAVIAAEGIISPLPDGFTPVTPEPVKPSLSFGQIVTAIPTPQPTSARPQILGVTAETSPVPTATPAPVHTKKKSYTIAFLGDSMIDTMGPGLPAVQNRLKQTYGATEFTLLNYGVGGTNIDYGLNRITNGYTYLGNPVPSLASVHPDIVVLESFGYNPFPDADGGIDRHWLALANTVSALRTAIPGVKIVIAATIAPNSKTFGDGAAGLAFGEMDKIQRTSIIKAYLDSTVKFAKDTNLPLADAYHASIDKNGDGILTYINGGDHIHYSDAGRALFAQKVVEAITRSGLL